MMVRGDSGDHPGKFGMVPFHLVVLTIWIDKSKGKGGYYQKIMWKFGGLMVTGNGPFWTRKKYGTILNRNLICAISVKSGGKVTIILEDRRNPS